MTTFTIKEDINKFSKTEFNTSKELYLYLKEKISPVSVFLVNENIPKSVLSSIKKSEEEGEDDVVDFKG